jgi:2-polyprenyl-3-methyl-5-hydroxy-6-metoxy-1,4-benzoquinol methylase
MRTSKRLLNANGPYEHGIWANGNISLENVEERAGTYLFFKRSFDLVEKISNRLLEIFSYEELADKTILDIGCYDAWILHQLNLRFNFKRAVGVEPRLKNIQKGEYARIHYGIESKMEILQGSIDSIGELFPETLFDIVLCLGTIHHVESTPAAITNISKASSDIIFIDSMVIEKPERDASNILRLLNLKDVVYLNSEYEWATAAFKFESPYFDGSSFKNQIVNVPEQRLIIMALSSLGFKILDVSSPEENFYTKRYQKLRGVKESFVFARKEDAKVLKIENWLEKASVYESIFTFTTVDLEFLRKWITQLKLSDYYDFVLKSGDTKKVRFRSRIFFLYSKKPTVKSWKFLVNRLRISKETLEILTNISRAPIDKILLEIAKRAIKDQNYGVAVLALETILDRDNADWRSFYRSSYLLSIIYSIQNESVKHQEMIELLRISNSEWPLNQEVGLDWALKNLNT